MIDQHPLVVVTSPGGSDLHVLITERLEIGRDCAGLLVDDPSVSRRHIALVPTPDGLAVTDLDSSNGTIVDGRQLAESTVVAAGASIRIGSTTIAVLRAGVGSVTLPTPVDRPQTSIERVANAAGGTVHDVPPDWGTITIVFSDIESSTDHTEALGDARWNALLAEHNDIVTRATVDHGGRVIKSLGDGFLVVFPGARHALNAMVAVQQIIPSLGDTVGRDFRVRVGIHAGEVITGDDGDIVGHHVVMAARVSDQAHGGEILVSSLVRSLIESAGDIDFGPPRTVALKGLGGEHVVHPVLYL